MTDVPPDLDYRHTTVRPQFADLPDQVRAALADAAGGRVVTARPAVTTGFTGAYAGVLELAGGGLVFAKAAGPAAPFALEALPREARVLRALGGRATAPQAVGSGATGEWEVLVLEAIEGDVPGMPWSAQDAEAAHRACLVAADLPPAEVAALTTASVAEDVGADPTALTCLDELASGERDWPHGTRAPADGHARDLAALGHEARAALGGDRLVHGDLRPDNMLVTPGGEARLVDWNWVARGPAWCDWVGLLPLMAHQGLDADALAQRSPLLEGVEPDAVDAFLAVIIGYLLEHAGHPTVPGSQSAVRAHQAQMARVFLAWLGHRRGW